MGLLDKATKIESQPTDSDGLTQNPPRQGLLERAKGLLDRARSNRRGLFERGMKFKEEAASRGLFQKASAARQSDFHEPEPVSLPEQQSIGSPDNTIPDDIQTGIEDTTDQNESLPELTDDLDFDLPDYEIPHSSNNDDPASGELEEVADPFTQWEQEAAGEAELMSQEATGEAIKDRLLIEDEQIMTTPVEMHIGSQKRIDNYLSLFELNRELHSIDDLEDFWDTALYSIIGQIGARSVVIFGPHTAEHHDDSILYPVAQSGVVAPDSWNLKKGDEIYDSLRKSSEIRYAGEFQKPTVALNAIEKEILTNCNASVLVSLGSERSFIGIAVIGMPLDRKDYVIDDLEYLRLWSESLVGPFERIAGIQRHLETTEAIRRENQLHRSLAGLSNSLQTQKTIDEIYDVLLSYFRDELKCRSLSLVLLDPNEQSYKIFAANLISPESLKRFELPVSGSELIGTISNVSGVFNLVDFRDHPEIRNCYTSDDLALMQKYWILPLINLNWLVGFLTIHQTDVPWTDEIREAALLACSHLAPVLANCLIVQERETLFRDPFSPLEKRLEREVNRAIEFHSFLSILDLRVRNLKKLLGANSMPVMNEFYQSLLRTLSQSLHQTDYMSRLGAGRYVILLPGRGKKEASVFSNRIQMELKQNQLLRGSAVAPTYSFDIISFPDDGDSLQKLIAHLDR